MAEPTFLTTMQVKVKVLKISFFYKERKFHRKQKEMGGKKKINGDWEARVPRKEYRATGTKLEETRINP